MGSDRCTRSRLVKRCCYGAFFGFGFVFTILTLAVMFWIAWNFWVCLGLPGLPPLDRPSNCYFGLTIIQVSDSQRRAIVNYSYTTSTKQVPTPTTVAPSRSTTLATEETSINSISKLPTTASVLRGSSRGELSQVIKTDKRKQEQAAAIESSLAKGDFAARDRAVHNTNATATRLPQDVAASAISSPRGPSKMPEEPRKKSGETAAILTASNSEEDDRVYPRRVLPPGTENRPEEVMDKVDRSVRRNPATSESASRPEISPTKVYDVDTTIGSSRLADPVDRPIREEARSQPRDYIDRDKIDPPIKDEIRSSRRPEPDSVYRDPDFDRDRDYPRRSSTSSDRSRSRYDDIDDDTRGSRRRYDERDRGRDSDDRYPKGDTRVYPDEKDLPKDDRIRDRYPDDVPKRGDDDRYDDRYRDRERDSTRYRDRDLARPVVRDDRYRDDVRYRPRDDDRYRDRDDDRYRLRDDDRPLPRDDRYSSKDDDRYRSRDYDKYVDDDRYRTKDDDRYKTRDGDRYRDDPEIKRDIPPRIRTDDDRYISRVDDAKYVDPPASRLGERKPVTSRTDYDIRGEESVVDIPPRDRPRVRDDVIPPRSSRPAYDDVIPPRSSRPAYDDDRYRDRDDYRRTRYDDDDRSISPTRTRIDDSISRSSLIDPRPVDDSRYLDRPRDRVRDDKYYDQDDKIRSSRVQESRIAPSSENSRRYIDDDRYRTRLPNERIEDTKVSDRREEVVLDRRSYASEEDEYRRGSSRTDNIYEDRTRSPTDDTRRYRDDESYPRRDPLDEDYKRSRTRDDYDRERSKSRDRYDDKYVPREEDRYAARGDRLPPLPVRSYETYPDDDERSRRRSSEVIPVRKEERRDRVEPVRPISSPRDDDRPYSRDAYQEPKSSSRRRVDDDLPRSDSRDYRDRDPDDRRYSGDSRSSREPLVSSMSSINLREPTEVVIREKRYQNKDSRPQNSRVYSDDVSSDVEPKSRGDVRPLSAKDVIDAAIRHSETSDQNARKVFYPVFDPRVSNLTSPDIIRPSERRGTTITAKKRRSINNVLAAWG